MFLNDGSGIRISANIDYVSVPDLFIYLNSYDFLEYVWKIEEDSLGSDDLPISLLITTKITFRHLLE